MQKCVERIVEIDLQIAGKMQGRRLNCLQAFDDGSQHRMDHHAPARRHDAVGIVRKIASFSIRQMQPNPLPQAIERTIRPRHRIKDRTNGIEMRNLEDFAAKRFTFEFECSRLRHMATAASVAFCGNGSYQCVLLPFY